MGAPSHSGMPRIAYGRSSQSSRRMYHIDLVRRGRICRYYIDAGTTSFRMNSEQSAQTLVSGLSSFWLMHQLYLMEALADWRLHPV
jgi:hypothetical protein